MKIKTFRARTMTEVMEMIKKELGPEAVILKSGKTAGSEGEILFEVQAAIDKAVSSPTASYRSEEHLKQIESKIEEITDFLAVLVSTKEHFLKMQSHRELTKIYNYLVSQEMDEKKVYVLLSKAAKYINHDSNVSRIVAAFCSELTGHLRTLNPFPEELAIPKDVLPWTYTFLGPTGAGKTTTLAKIATILKIERNLPVGIINLDNYRIGATEQLETYARILELPFISVQSREELEFARKQLKECKVLLVDTTGKNFLMPDHVSEVMTIFDDLNNIRHFLVLSATSKDRDLMKTIQHFEPLGVYSLIFTKIDETLSYGNIINQLLRFPYPVSYLGIGQKVPEDIEEASKKRIIKMLFPGNKKNNL